MLAYVRDALTRQWCATVLCITIAVYVGCLLDAHDYVEKIDESKNGTEPLYLHRRSDHSVHYSLDT